jgi:autotransporter passenger strand-loop-strand repeat protein
MSGGISGIVISSGQVSSGLVVSGATDSLTIENGGTAIATFVAAGGQAGNLGVAVSTTVVGGGSFVNSAGTDYGSYIGAGGVEVVFLQTEGDLGGPSSRQVIRPALSGYAVSATVASGGALIVDNAAAGVTVESGGVLLVSSGGVATGVDVQSGGVVVALPGAQVSGSAGVISPSDIVALYPGSVGVLGSAAASVAVTGGEVLDVFQSDTVGSLTVAASGSAVLFSGATVTAVTVSSGGSVLLSAGLVEGGTVLPGGELQLLAIGSGTGSAVDLQISGFAVLGGYTSGDTVHAGGELFATPGSSFDTVVMSGGVANLTYGADNLVESGGREGVYGIVSGDVVQAGGSLFVAGLSVDATIASGGTVFVNSIGTLSGADAPAGAVIVVLAGGQVSNLSGGGAVTSAGLVLVQADGGFVLNPAGPVTVSSGAAEYVLSGTTALAATVLSGGIQYVDGGVAQSTMLASGGYMEVFAGTALDTVVSGADLIGQDGVVSGATVFSGGLVEGEQSGVGIYGTVVRAGGTIVDDGAPTTGTQISAGGIDQVQSPVVGATVFAGGTQIDESNGGTFGGTSFGTVVLSDGLLIDQLQASGTVISAGAFMLVTEAASAVSTTVASGGFMLLISGGIGSATSGPGVVLSSGVLVVSADGAYVENPSGRVVLSGAAHEFAFGSGVVASGAVIGSGAQQIIFSEASGTVVQSGGVQIISAGVAYDSLLVGGTEEMGVPLFSPNYVYLPGGTAYDTTIGTSGLLVYAHGAVSGGVTFSGTGGVFDDEVSYNESMPGGVALVLPAIPEISGFASGDGLILPFEIVPGTSPVISGSTVSFTDIANSYFQPFSVTFANVAGSALSFVDDSVTGTTEVEVTALCFLAGTMIETPGGGVPVERLAVGDLVMTHVGPRPVKWLGRRAYGRRFVTGEPMATPVCIAAGALGSDTPRRNLFVSPGHGILVEGQLIPAWRLINGVSITQPPPAADVVYTHIELDDHAIVYAEGAPAETFLEEGLRGRFQNAADYYQLYPGPVPARETCFPRLEDGFLLQSLWQRIAKIAGCARPATLGRLRGEVEQQGPTGIAGWALDEAAPERPVCLDVMVFGVPVRRVLANIYRPALRARGLGNGACGFAVMLPATLSGPLTVRRSEDHAPLLGDAGPALRLVGG